MSEGWQAKLTRHKKTIAVTLSLALHVLAFWALMPSSSSHLAELTSTGDGEQVEAVHLDLVSLHNASPQTQSPPQPKLPLPSLPNMDTFMRMSGPSSNVTPLPNSSSPSTQSITKALGENPFLPPAETANKPKASQEAHVKINDSNNKTMNDLWQAIAPCWDRIADQNTLGVTLNVSFSPLGNLAKPPAIQRLPNAKITTQTLKSESQAIDALSQCGPYLMAYGQQGVQIQFPGKS